MMVRNGGYSFPVPKNGASGVDLFFIISGFIMIYTCSGTFRNSGASASFLRRRFIRIVPVYWFYTSVIVLLVVFVPTLFKSTVFDWYTVISSYLFLQSEVRGGDVGTMLQTGWTLCYEVYFYLIFAVLLNFSQKYFLPICGLVFSFGYLLGLVAELPIWLSLVSNPILFEFLLGAILASIFIRGFYLSQPLAIASIAFGFYVILYMGSTVQGEWARVINWGLPGAAILFGALSLEQSGLKIPKFLIILGDSSYTLYLAHPFFLPLFGQLWIKFALAESLPAEVLFLVALIGTIAMGHLLYLVIEKPVTRLVFSWMMRKQKSLNGMA